MNDKSTSIASPVDAVVRRRRLPKDVRDDLSFVRKAILENLQVWAYKDELVLFEAFQKIERLLKR